MGIIQQSSGVSLHTFSGLPDIAAQFVVCYSCNWILSFYSMCSKFQRCLW